jgi:hypothetical protein
MDLVRHGYKVHPMGPYDLAWPDRRSLRIHATTRPATTTSWPGGRSGRAPRAAGRWRRRYGAIVIVRVEV